jgi:hypothetical protein
MKRLSYSEWFLGSALAVACATVMCTPPGEQTKSPEKAQGCDSAHPCAAGEMCVDGTCRPQGCASDGDCGGTAACIEGSCTTRECRANLTCLGEDETAGTADDRSCIGGVCLPISCPRDGDRCPGPGKEKCDWNSDCGSGRLCFGGNCTSARCTGNQDCGTRMCYVGLCLDRECDSKKPCSKGRNCVKGLCLAPAATGGASVSEEAGTP